jgi:hypothetical protein
MHEHFNCVFHGSGADYFSGVNEEDFVSIGNGVEAVK